MDEFYRLAMPAELAFPNVHMVHATLVQEGDLAICGVGETISEGPLLGVEAYTRTTVEYLLRPLWRSDRTRKVLLLAAAPSGSLGWPKGKPLVWDLIDSYHPDLCAVYGGGEAHGSQMAGKTLVVNPGWLADGRAAWLDWGHRNEDQVEFINLAAQKQ